ncbi:hypothetical protein PW52_00975 [Tamlana sedimentorum]|uniref:Uncharacterized protein n=1 Tax=Neotamlana sedimentorum TaxID=1435349 RepID=A0A0D7WED5_9FLAO|nr:hypothetical protein PW52_00975 [Tamlana sedimentorum]
MPTKAKKHLNNYWLAVLISFISMGISYKLKNNDDIIILSIISFIVVPMLIATYHLYISYLLKTGRAIN